MKFQHTAARRRLPFLILGYFYLLRLFQHTAARRRLHDNLNTVLGGSIVSTHSRTEAAALAKVCCVQCAMVSTHSRTEAAACVLWSGTIIVRVFQHTAARRRLLSYPLDLLLHFAVSTHSRTEAAAKGKIH